MVIHVQTHTDTHLAYDPFTRTTFNLCFYSVDQSRSRVKGKPSVGSVIWQQNHKLNVVSIDGPLDFGR